MPNNRTSDNSATLLREASATTADFMREGIDAIDGEFGADYAKEHPTLIVAFLLAGAIDLGTAAIARALDQPRDHSHEN